MNRILKRFVFLQFTAEVRDIFDRTRSLAILLRFPSVRPRWLVSVSSHMMNSSVSGRIVGSKEVN